MSVRDADDEYDDPVAKALANVPLAEEIRSRFAAISTRSASGRP